MSEKRLGQIVMEDGRHGTVSVEIGDDDSRTITAYEVDDGGDVWKQELSPATYRCRRDRDK
jgi:hypothetical protein